ncbi:UDP-galactopyranose mutase [Deltaproteobacteria bacterium]|nr:UDP-galactopyranose mutase [Deltaproteobacteria bacterium]
MDLSGLKYIVVGAGLWGATLAERIAVVLGEPVLVIERRDHIGGNCFDKIDSETEIECHVYGTHIFHTKLRRVWEYVNTFSSFTSYRHRVFTLHQGHVYPMPINLATINSFYRMNFRPFEASALLAKETRKESGDCVTNLEDKIISLVGRPLYEAFIKGYTQKQWQKNPRALPAFIINRLPVRTNYNADYFDDQWQGMPEDGYAAMISHMLSHPNITVRLGVSFQDIAERISPDSRVFYSGPIDEFFNYALGVLEWRTLRFAYTVENYPDFQGCPVLNYADSDISFTRVHEFKHLYPERGIQGNKTLLAYEYPQAFSPDDEPFYPVNTSENQSLLSVYEEKAACLPRFVFGGRLGSYKYLDMDRTIDAALGVFDTLKNSSGIKYR